MVKFKATIRKYGNSHVVTIPADYINNEMVEPKKEYWFTINEENEKNH